MTWFEPGSSGIGSDRAVSSATAIVQIDTILVVTYHEQETPLTGILVTWIEELDEILLQTCLHFSAKIRRSNHYQIDTIQFALLWFHQWLNPSICWQKTIIFSQSHGRLVKLSLSTSVTNKSCQMCIKVAQKLFH